MNVHSYTSYTIRKIIALIWCGINDANAMTDELIRSNSTEQGRAAVVALRKQSLIDSFIEMYSTYDSGMNICIGGMIHKLVECLNRSHPEVVIITTASSAKT